MLDLFHDVDTPVNLQTVEHHRLQFSPEPYLPPCADKNVTLAPRPVLSHSRSISASSLPQPTNNLVEYTQRGIAFKSALAPPSTYLGSNDE